MLYCTMCPMTDCQPAEIPLELPPIPQPIFKEEAAQRITELLINLANEEAENPLEDEDENLNSDTEISAVENETVESDTSTSTSITPAAGTLAYFLVKRQKLLEFYVNKLVADILVYCHRRDFPEPLIYTAVELIKARLENDIESAANGTSAPISEITQDDTSYKFAVNAINLASIFGDELFNSIKPKLNLYRRLKSL